MKNISRVIAVAAISSLNLAAQMPTFEEAIRIFSSARLPVPATTKSFPGGNPKIDPALLAGDGAMSKGIGGSGRISVELLAADESAVPGIRESVTREGGEVTATFENTVLAQVPTNAIPALGKLGGLYFMTIAATAHGGQEAPPEMSKGPELVDHIGARRLHNAGIRGRGVKIGILDFGFARYAELVSAGKLPRPVATKAFNVSQRVEGDENNEVHGTGCAEIIYSMAPEAELYLATTDGDEGRTIAAAQWLASQHVQIISFSAGMFVGPHNGRARLDRMVDKMVRENRILWVNSSGNSGDAHWMGDALKRDAEGWIQFDATNQDKLYLEAAEKKVSIDVVWDDWGNDPLRPAATQAIDAYLYTLDKNRQPTLRVTREFSVVDRNQPKLQFELQNVEKGTSFMLRLRTSRVNRPLKVHVYSAGFVRQRPNTAEGSITIPATSANALSVGAVSFTSGQLEPYSSRGPTDDGRAKPDVSAFDRVPSPVYADGFAGTSAACPYAAGVGALVLQTHPQLSGAELRNAVIRYIRPKSDPGYGRGILDASKIETGPVSGGGGGIALPDAFGGSISVAALERLRSHASEFHAFGSAVALGRGNPVYRIGEQLKFAYKSSENCYYVVLDRNVAGEYTAVIPGSTRDPAKLEAGRGYVFPAAEKDHINVTLPAGREEFILLCTRSPLRLEELVADGWDRLKGMLSVSIATYEVTQ